MSAALSGLSANAPYFSAGQDSYHRQLSIGKNRMPVSWTLLGCSSDKHPERHGGALLRSPPATVHHHPPVIWRSFFRPPPRRSRYLPAWSRGR